MMLIIHILIATASIGLASFAYFRPSVTLLRATYATIALTLGTGTYLIVMSPAHMVQACATGVAYLVVVGAIALAAKAKFANMRPSA
ncbi:MAG TPA: hypothetical protein VFZ62_03505 [Candidatus Saccharimonadales bacterium]